MGYSSFIFGLGSIVVLVCSLFSQPIPLVLPRAARWPSPYRARTRERAKRTRYRVSSRVVSHDISQVESLFTGYSKLSTRRTLLELVMSFGLIGGSVFTEESCKDTPIDR